MENGCFHVKTKVQPCRQEDEQEVSRWPCKPWEIMHLLKDHCCCSSSCVPLASQVSSFRVLAVTRDASSLKGDSVLTVSEWGSFMWQRRILHVHHARSRAQGGPSSLLIPPLLRLRSSKTSSHLITSCIKLILTFLLMDMRQLIWYHP